MKSVTFKGQATFLHGAIPKVGEMAKNFILVDRDLQSRELSHFSRSKKVLITVVSLDTSVCLLETKHLNTLAKKYPSVDFLLISSDLPFAMQRICLGEKIDNLYPLSMIRSKDFGRDYGILIASGPLEGLLARGIFVIDSMGKFIYSDICSEITEEPDYSGLTSLLNH